MPMAGGLTGGPRRLLTLVRQLHSDGVEVIILSEPRSDLLRVAAEFGLAVYEVPTLTPLSGRNGALLNTCLRTRLWTVINLLRQNLVVALALRRVRADLVWTRSAKGIAFCGLAAMLSGRKIIWDLVGDVHRGAYVSLLYRFGLFVARAVVFQYAAAPAEIFDPESVRRHRHKLIPIIPGIDFGRLENNVALVNSDKYKPSKVFVMLQVGTVCANKNQAFTLRVLQLARDRGLGHDWELWLAFDEMVDPSVATLIEELELVHFVKLLGWRNDVPDLMCEADLLLHPSISEGIPNVVQESMYLGLPVVASDAGGLPEIIANDRNGWVIDTDQPEAWADRITWCRNHPEQRRKVGEEAAKHARAHFNSEEWAAAYSRVFMGEV